MSDGSTQEKPMSNVRGPMLMVASMAGFAIGDALIKALSARLPAGQIALLMGVGGTLVLWTVARAQGQRLFVAQAVRGAALVRNVAEMGAAMGMILSIALVPLSVFSAILQVMPLTVTLAAAVFLGEPVGWRRWSAILVGFAGVMLILRPGTEAFDIRLLLPLGALMLLTTRDIATRRVPAGITSLQLSGWGFIAVMPGGVLLMLLRAEAPLVPTMNEGVLLIATVIASILGYAALVLATRAGNFATTTPFRYSRLVFAMAIGVTVFGERPDAATLIGSALVVSAGLYTLVREMRLARR
jgi:drug/metabolite transporter (DMT)-like permease